MSSVSLAIKHPSNTSNSEGTEKQILFDTKDIQSILAGIKKVTRRVINPQPMINWNYTSWFDETTFKWSTCHPLNVKYPNQEHKVKCPYGKVGDILWVREKWCNINKPGVTPEYYYYADVFSSEDYMKDEWKWKSSIHMPHEAARIFLRITKIDVQRLQDISEEDAISEGSAKAYYQGDALWHGGMMDNHRDGFREEWDRHHMWPKTWTANPWVWVIEFERI